MTQLIEIKVPDIGDFSDIPVVEVLVEAGDAVEAEQSLVTLESDKAMMEVPAPVAGVVREVRVVLDDTVSEGDVVAVIEADEVAESTQSEPETPPQADKAQPAEVEPTTPQQAPAPPPALKTRKPAPPATGNRQSPPVPMDANATLPANIPYASPAIRRFARELGVDLARVTGSSRGGRIVREDVTGFLKSVMAGAAAPASGALGFDLPPPPVGNPA